MKEKIYTIPINEEFEKKDGCPFCGLYARSRERALEYITGSAMMEPAVRISSNEQGFCDVHFADMIKLNTRLSLALMLESHMDETGKRVFSSSKSFLGRSYDPDKVSAQADKVVESCFVCNRINTEMSHYFGNTVYMWKSEPTFQTLFSHQQGFCLPHLSRLLKAGKSGLNKKELFDFTQTSVRLSEALHMKLRAELAEFTKSFDYRFSGAAKDERVKRAIENTVSYLSSSLR